MKELKVLPEVREQRRPRRIVTDIARSSIKEQNCLGYDTETIDGKCYMLSLETVRKKKSGGWEITPKVYYTETFTDVVNAFLENGRIYFGSKGVRGFSHPTYFAYNLKFDAQAFIKLLPDALISKVYEENIVCFNYETLEEVVWDDEETDHSKSMQIFYLPKKHMGWRFHKKMLFQPPTTGKRTPKPINGGQIEMFDIAQFYGMSLNNASKKHLNDSKVESCFDGTPLDVKKLGKTVMVKKRNAYGHAHYEPEVYHEYYADDIEYYCMYDTVLCGRLARKKLREFVDAKVSFRTPYSVAAIAQRDLLNKLYEEVMPDISEHKVAGQIALTAFKGGWFEAREVGYIEDVCTYDLKSAYPANQWNIPSMTKWTPVTYTTKKGEVKERIKHGQVVMEPVLRGDFVYGESEEELIALVEPRTDLSPAFVKAYIKFPEGYEWYPVCYVDKKPPLTTPRIVRGWMTYDEFAEAKKWNPEVCVVESWCVWVDEEEEHSYPFRDFIQYWFNVKESMPKDDPSYLISKILLNSIYGKTIQEVNGRAGLLWNPFQAAMTTGYCRTEIARFIRYNDRKVCMVATDGVIIRRKDFKAIPPRRYEAPSNLGEWEQEYGEKKKWDAIIMMSGVYSLREQEPSVKKADFVCDGMQVKIKESFDYYEVPKFRGSASYFLDDFAGWVAFCLENQSLTEVKTSVIKPYSLGEARFDFELINIFDDRDFTMKARGDSTKRLYDVNNQPETFADLLNNSYVLNTWPSYLHVDMVINKTTGEEE